MIVLNAVVSFRSGFPAQETLKCYSIGYESGNHGCTSTPDLISFSWNIWQCDIRYFRTKLLLTSRRPFLITFTKKSYLRSETL